jgi:predicted membrane protein
MTLLSPLFHLKNWPKLTTSFLMMQLLLFCFQSFFFYIIYIYYKRVLIFLITLNSIKKKKERENKHKCFQTKSEKQSILSVHKIDTSWNIQSSLIFEEEQIYRCWILWAHKQNCKNEFIWISIFWGLN